MLFLKDLPLEKGINLQEPSNLITLRLIILHNLIMFIVIFLVVGVGFILINILLTKNKNKYLTHSPRIEQIWTIIPMLITLYIAYNSIWILYENDSILEPKITIKAIGHQWYWEYEQNDWIYGSINIDQYMKPTNDLIEGEVRLLEVSDPYCFPVNTQVRLMTYSKDVIHSFAIPSLGLKSDAVPGRINQLPLESFRVGTFYGQCSEICGELHAFMPCCLKSLTVDQWNIWLKNNIEMEDSF
uniref:cytochrome c oxidase subunit II n=1 Tax=Rosacea flaccida TaxID=316189 RepID=UPI0026E2DCC3|nr:cytochrome c oxidase subunit II [Rosacea flaccida]WJJ70105.1 cytochrome c oxidase subunit 2 [Rosacea flaccida]